MRAITLLYHDVVSGGAYQSSGFRGADADIYKMDRRVFEAHLDAIAEALEGAAVAKLPLGAYQGKIPVLLAFDDGGASTWENIAPMLEERGWHGHFFIPTDWIGKPGFLTSTQIGELHRRGHIIGSHSQSHPPRISSLPAEQILREWRGSSEILASILGEPPSAASVPGGYYSRLVGKAAAMAGIRSLFNSEPLTGVRPLGSCMVYGRYSIQRDTPPAVAGAIAAGAILPRLEQFAYWTVKKILKAIGGEAWLRFRKRWFHQANQAKL